MPTKRERREQLRVERLKRAQQRENNKEEGEPLLKKPTPKTYGQRRYLAAMMDSRIIFCNGPAGTGKTHLAIGYALQLLKEKRIARIVITRPIVPIGNRNRIGFLPGNLLEKIQPFLLPILDEASHFIHNSELQNLLHNKYGLFSRIEICPLDHIRGRTYHDAILIIDEAQNCTKEELIAAITRLGRESKIIIQGDSTQSDLFLEDAGAFEWIAERMYGVDGIEYVKLENGDIVRDELISRILDRLQNVS